VTTPAPSRRLVTTGELAAVLRVSRQKVYRLVKCRRIRALRMNDDRRCQKRQVLRFDLEAVLRDLSDGK